MTEKEYRTLPNISERMLEENRQAGYDIDKVVKQLEEDCKILKLGNDGFTVVALHIEEALKILKAGGNA